MQYLPTKAILVLDTLKAPQGLRVEIYSKEKLVFQLDESCFFWFMVPKTKLVRWCLNNSEEANLKCKPYVKVYPENEFGNSVSIVQDQSDNKNDLYMSIHMMERVTDSNDPPLDPLINRFRIPDDYVIYAFVRCTTTHNCKFQAGSGSLTSELKYKWDRKVSALEANIHPTGHRIMSEVENVIIECRKDLDDCETVAQYISVRNWE